MKRRGGVKEQATRLRLAARRDRRRLEETRRQEAERREQAVREALARPQDTASASLREFLAARPAERRTARLRDFLDRVVERAPRLAREDLLPAVSLLAEATSVRPLDDWRPSGKSPESIFFSLAEHLLARYPMPRRLWTALYADEGGPALARVVEDVAAGGSLFEAVRSGLLPVPLTRRMCHEVLAPGSESRFLRAVRRAQVVAAGGGTRLFDVWVRTRAGSRLHDRAGELFWSRALGWFAANPMLAPREVPPLVDYIAHRRAEDPGFSLKGRSVLALMRAMQQWHRELGRATGSARRVFRPCGLEPMDLDRSRKDARGNRIVEVWHFREILDGRTLADEGRSMGHCVYSYGHSIESGECAIWTQTLEDGAGHWRSLTIEVRPRRRAIVQARGRFNRMPEPRERLALEAWAARNSLSVSIGA